MGLLCAAQYHPESPPKVLRVLLPVAPFLPLLLEDHWLRDLAAEVDPRDQVEALEDRWAVVPVGQEVVVPAGVAQVVQVELFPFVLSVAALAVDLVDWSVVVVQEEPLLVERELAAVPMARGCVLAPCRWRSSSTAQSRRIRRLRRS